MFDILLSHLLHLCIDRRQLRRSSRRNHSLYVDKLFFVDTESDLAPDAFVQLDFKYPKFCVFLGKFVFKGIDFERISVLRVNKLLKLKHFLSAEIFVRLLQKYNLSLQYGHALEFGRQGRVELHQLIQRQIAQKLVPYLSELLF